MTASCFSRKVNAVKEKGKAMSTITFDYANTIQPRRSFNIRSLIILIATLALVMDVILAATSVKVDSSSSSFLSSVAVVPVPVAPTTDSHVLPVVTATPTINRAIIAIPVPTPPSQ